MDEGLDQADRRPRLVAAGLHDDRRFQSNGRKPQGIHRRRVAGHHQPECLGGGVKTDLSPKLFTNARIENRRINTSCKAIEHHIHVGQCVMYFVHVTLNHHVRQAAGRGQGFDVLPRRLGFSIDPDLHLAIEKYLTGLRADSNELGRGEFTQSSTGFINTIKIAPNHAGIDLAHGGFHCPITIIVNFNLIEAHVRIAETKARDMRYGHFSKLPPRWSFPWRQTAAPRQRHPTDRHPTGRAGWLRRVPRTAA